MSPASPADDDVIAVTGFGLVSSVGATAAGSAAAIRSGIARFRISERIQVPANGEETEFDGALISLVPDLDENIGGIDRAVALMAPAIRDCVETSGLSLDSFRAARCDLSNHIETEKPADGQEFFQSLAGEFPWLQPARKRPPEPQSVLRHADVFERIIAACECLRAGPGKMVIVGTVDSLSTSPAIDQLHLAGRLKSATRPDGVIPGEAAGVLVLEIMKRSVARRTNVCAVIETWGRGQETKPWVQQEPSQATGLTTACKEALGRLDDKGLGIGLVVSDLNGERARALEWALTEPRVFPFPDAVRSLWHPADSVGDCGAVIGAVLVIAACFGLSRGYARTRRVALMTSDDNGGRRVLCLASATGG